MVRAHAANSGEASADFTRQRDAGRPGHGRRNYAGARQGLPGSLGSLQHLQRRSLHSVPVSRRGRGSSRCGDFAWQVPLGITESLPEGKQNTGAQNTAGPIVTAGGLVFIGSTNDSRLRAFDSRSGKELWVTKLEYTATAVPMTYQGKNGKQYVAIVAASGGAASGGAVSGGRGGSPSNNQSLVVFALP